MTRRVCLYVSLVGLLTAACSEYGGEPANKSRRSKTELIRVAGSEDVYLLTEILARQFERTTPGYRVVLSPPTLSRGGIAEAALGTADIGLVARQLKPEEDRGNTTFLHLAKDIVVFATHRSVGVNNLSREQLLDIYAGKIANWKEVGGPDAAITVLDLADHLSLKIVLRQQLFGPALVVTPAAIVLNRAQDVLTSLHTIENSIGYLSLGNVTLEHTEAGILRLDAVAPTLSNLQQGRYTLARPFGLLIGPSPSRATMLFVKFLHGEEARRDMELNGFLPITMDFTVGVLPEQGLLAQQRRYEPLMDYLGQELRLPLKPKLELLPSYAAAVEAFRSGRIDAAFLGSLDFALARAQVGVEPLVRPEKNGVSSYRGVIVARKDSGIADWRDLKGRSFGFVDKSTTAGYIFPLLYFRQHGITHPEDYLGSTVYTGSHDLVFTKVYKGELDAGAAKDLILTELAKSSPKIAEELRVLDSSPPVPNNVFVLASKREFPCFDCHSSSPPASLSSNPNVPRGPDALKSTLTRAFLSLPESANGRRVLEALGADRFIETTLDDLQVVNQLLQDAGFDPGSYRP